jgi:hypothetical protein
MTSETTEAVAPAAPVESPVATVRREWTGVEVDPEEAYCMRCGWARMYDSAVEAVRQANAHICDFDDDLR